MFVPSKKFYFRLSVVTVLLIFTILLSIERVKNAIDFLTFWCKHNATNEFNSVEQQKLFAIESEKIVKLVSEYRSEKLNCRSKELKIEYTQYGRYWLFRNLFIGSLSQTMHCGESITFTTHCDYTFLDNLENLMERWLGPISLAIFAPGFDFEHTLDSIQYVRNCLPKSKLIRDYVSFHIYFPRKHAPSHVPTLEEGEAFKWSYHCFVSKAPYRSVNKREMYKSVNNLTYPINVGRNIARKSVNTHFILACDIELYPSPGLIRGFLEMIDENFLELISSDRRVFPLPVFELREHARLPNDKYELVEQLINRTARAFHSHICRICHLVPRQSRWIRYRGNDYDKLQVLIVATRFDRYESWEPTFISDNQEPYFDERFTWEAQADRRIQAFAMCLLKYEYHVLHPAFLVHRPGIKVLQRNAPHVVQAKEIHTFIEYVIKPEYRSVYGYTEGCVT